MEFYKLLLITLFTLQTTAFLLVSTQAEEVATATESNVFRAYIGAGSKNVGEPVRFSDVPINPDVEFHFMLAFAVDCSSSDSTSPSEEGIFNVFWDKTNLSPEEVTIIKNDHQNVKVVLSIGGDSCGAYAVEFNAISVETWVSNAVTSLTNIITEYHLDGIDIDYEQFIASPETFTYCMGELVMQLKESQTISIASIAPWENEEVQSHYQALWTSYGKYIDYVNFQFYAYDKYFEMSLFLNYFDQQSLNYYGGKMLVGFSTDVDAGGLSTDDGFFDACQKLKSDGKLAGIFVWSADQSKAGGFAFETQSQTVLAALGGSVQEELEIENDQETEYVLLR